MSTIPELSVDLIDGEEIEFGDGGESSDVNDEELNRRYIEEGVRIVVDQARYPLNQILNMFRDTFETDDGQREFKYKRDPEYQRRHRWSQQRQSRLVESFLMNVPVPPVFLYEYELARFEVMDGRQRLTALMEFYSDDLILTGLEYWPDLDGKTYSTLPSAIRDGVDRRYLSSIVLLKETAVSEEQAASLKKMVFERLNSGGVKLSGQETRNAVFDGPLNDLCLELSANQTFRRILGTPTMRDESADDREEEALVPESDDSEFDGDVEVTPLGRKMFESMEDVELVLRFFAYRHLDKFSQGLNRVSDFLDTFLVEGNKLGPEVLQGYRDLFVENLEFWSELRGERAFQVEGSKRRFSKIAFDALMYASSALSAEQRSLLLQEREKTNLAIDQMYAAGNVHFGGRKTNYADAKRRNELALSSLSAALT